MAADDVLLIRDFEEPDLAAVLRLNVDAEGPEPDLANFREVTARANKDLLDVKKSFADGAFLVGVLDGNIVAMASVRREEGTIYEMNFVRVDHNQHRRGLGRKIVAAAEERARALGATEMVLSTTLRQESAQRLYEAAGYSETKHSIYESENGRFEMVHYAKTLT